MTDEQRLKIAILLTLQRLIIQELFKESIASADKIEILHNAIDCLDDESEYTFDFLKINHATAKSLDEKMIQSYIQSISALMSENTIKPLIDYFYLICNAIIG